MTMKIDMNKKLTIVIAGHFVEQFENYLQYLLYSMTDHGLDRCNYVLYYDESSCAYENRNKNINKIQKILDKYSIKNHKIILQKGGLLSAFYGMCNNISTKYVMFLEHDWVFLRKPEYTNIIKAMDNHNFVKCVKFKKLGNIKKQLNAVKDGMGNEIPLIEDTRIKETSLIQACYWSNNPFICKIETLRLWSKNFLSNEIIQKIKTNSLNRGSRGIEEIMIKKYTLDIHNRSWESIKDDWGVFLYGPVGMEPIIAHTDGSKRYNGIPESLGQKWIVNYTNVLQRKA